MSTPYRITFTIEAKATYDSLPAERRAVIDRAFSVLSRDPYQPKATAALSSENERKAYVAPGIVVEYFVRQGVMIVVVMEIFDESAYLIDQADASI
jgi:hypothetical protein